MLTCMNCGQPRDLKNRRLCQKCYTERHRQEAKIRYKFFGHALTITVCQACGKTYEAQRSNGRFCGDCWKLRNKLAASTGVTNRYVNLKTPGETEHRQLAIKALGHLHVDDFVHHLDGNPKNNDLRNLIVLDRRDHAALHCYLADQRVIFEKSKNENSENCWETLRTQLTTTWLETANVKVTKLIEIGQSAAEPLSAEGSETMHGASERMKI